MIELSHVTKRYGSIRAVDDVSFSVDAGEAIALWGTNGAGKTTLLRCMLGTIPYDGDITVDGRSTSRQGKAARERIGYVPQEMPTFDASVGEMVHLIARLRNVPAHAGFTYLEQLRLGGTFKQSMGSLSGGMKQKVALALALLGTPSVLLLDEPTANLDERSQADLVQTLLELKAAGRTLVFTSHHWSEVESLADRVVILERGAAVDIRAINRITPANVTRLRIRVGPGERERAASTLSAAGMAADPTASGILVVEVDAERKAAPLTLLTHAGISPLDFEIAEDA